MNPINLEVAEEFNVTSTGPLYVNLLHPNAKILTENEEFRPHRFTIGGEWQTKRLELIPTDFHFGCTPKKNEGEQLPQNLFYSSKAEAQQRHPDNKIENMVKIEGVIVVSEEIAAGVEGPDGQTYQPVKIDFKGTKANQFLPVNKDSQAAYEKAGLDRKTAYPIAWVFDVKIIKGEKGTWSVPEWVEVYQPEEEVAEWAANFFA